MDNVQGENIFAAATAAQTAVMRLARAHLAREIVDILSAEKDDGHAIARVAALCTREAK